MPAIRMSLLDAKRMAAALIPFALQPRHTYHDDVLSTVVVAQGDGQFAYASDRYTVGQYDLTNVTTEWPSEPMQIPLGLLSAVLTIGKATLIDPLEMYEVWIQTGVAPRELRMERDPAVQRWEAVLRVRRVVPQSNPDGDAEPAYELQFLRVFPVRNPKTAFPPVGRLFTEWIPGGEQVMNPIVLNPDYMSKFTGYARRIRSNMRITIPVRSGGTAGQRGLMVEVGTRLKGLLMPLLFQSGPSSDFGKDIVAENVVRAVAADMAAIKSPDVVAANDE